MSIAVLGGGAFGTALAVALSQDGTPVALWSRNVSDIAEMRDKRMTGRKLPVIALPDSLTLQDKIPDADISLLAIPAQMMRSFLEQHQSNLQDRALISCAKGIELGTGLGPVDLIESVLPSARAGCLTGPSFAIDIAHGLPTALVLAMAGDTEHIQSALTRPALRVYRTSDVTGAQLGGAVKNVIALAAGVAIGAGLGDSARASVIARGFAELSRFAEAKGARVETLHGLSGLGDLVLTCTSEKSRNFAAGRTLGQGQHLDPAITVEGIATAQAVSREAQSMGIEMPLSDAVAAVTRGTLDIATAIETLLARPAGKE